MSLRSLRYPISSTLGPITSGYKGYSLQMRYLSVFFWLSAWRKLHGPANKRHQFFLNHPILVWMKARFDWSLQPVTTLRRAYDDSFGLSSQESSAQIRNLGRMRDNRMALAYAQACIPANVV
jgi:hypothetical protein